MAKLISNTQLRDNLVFLKTVFMSFTCPKFLHWIEYVQHNSEVPSDNIDDAFKTGAEDQAAIGE